MIINKNTKLNICAYISILVIILALIVIFFMIYKYQVEGEAIPPFKISKMIVVSSAKTEDLVLSEGTYNANIIQTNDVKISIEKNPQYKKDAIIKKVIINNIKINQGETKGTVEIFRPSKGIKLYDYKEQYYVKNELVYFGAQETYIKGDKLQISNQGGIIDFSIILNNIGQLNYKENETIKVNGTLLKQMGFENINYQVEFDLIIELENDIKLKTKIFIDLPTGDILENGIETLEKTDLKTIFKRI